MAQPFANLTWSGRRGSNSRHSAWKAEALPTELLPLLTSVDFQSNKGLETTAFLQIADNAPRKKPCSSLRPRFITEISYIQLTNWLVVGGGFEPPKASPTDLQSVPFDHSGTPPERINIPSPKTNPIRSLQQDTGTKIKMEPAEGFEPPTH